jgi:hypothetical protein
MSTKKGLGRLYDKLSLEERFRLDVLAMAREAVRRGSAGPRGAERTARGGGGRGRRGRVLGHDDGGVALRIRECVREIPKRSGN